MPRERSGCVRYDNRKGCYAIRITLNGSKRSPWIPLSPATRSPDAEKRAREVAVERTKIARDEESQTRELPDDAARAERATEAGGRIVSEWVKRWLESRTARGLSSVSDDKGRLEKHVLPILGPLAMPTVTKDDVERLVEHLDAKILAGKFCVEDGELLLDARDHDVQGRVHLEAARPARAPGQPHDGRARARDG